jgi:triphosphoribosyl-dephospho-CoA synthase
MNLAEQIELACLIEATARKPGNVHPRASFDDLTYDDFVTAARIAAPILADAAKLGVGRAVLEAVRATVAEAGTNVNLGICLLIAPLAAAPPRRMLKHGVKDALKNLTIEDARHVYEAIRLCKPGGLGESQQQDVREVPTQTLLEVMTLAANRDGIAREYAWNYRSTFLVGVRGLLEVRDDQNSVDITLPVPPDGVPMTEWEFSTILTHLFLLNRGDTLILRKCGEELFLEAVRRAERVLIQGYLYTPASVKELAGFDAWLRADGHRRNPGTTADLIAAVWFAAIRDGLIVPPTTAEIISHAARIRNAGRMDEEK